MKDFDYYLGEGEVKKQAPDRNLAESLIQDARECLAYAKASPLKEKTAKYIYEDVYDALREAADAILALEGLKSYSHVATISFLARFDFPKSELEELERLRKKRNGMKYYGKSCSTAEAKEAIEFSWKLFEKLLKIFIALKNKR